MSAKCDGRLTASEHPASCSHFVIRCSRATGRRTAPAPAGRAPARGTVGRRSEAGPTAPSARGHGNATAAHRVAQPCAFQLTFGFRFRIFQSAMPHALPSPCPARGCRTLTTGGLCDTHRKARHQAVDSRRVSSHARGYDGQWRKVRAWVLSQPPSGRRDAAGVVVGHGPLCVFCAVERGRVTPAKDVDHIDGDSRNNVHENLRSLCHGCHSSRTATDQGFARSMA